MSFYFFLAPILLNLMNERDWENNYEYLAENIHLMKNITLSSSMTSLLQGEGKNSILFLKKKGKYYSPNGQTFNDFLNGNLNYLNGEKPTLEDFENHLGTIFTELRLKQVIEFRSLDTCNFGCICNGPSFFTGLIYGSLDETYEIIKDWKKEDVMEAYLNAPKRGLNTLLYNKKLIDWGKIFLDLSKKGLEKRNELNKSGKNETIYLKHIEKIIKNKKTRAEMLIEQFNKTKNLNFLVNHDENFSYSGF